jgi:Lon protease-like protein
MDEVPVQDFPLFPLGIVALPSESVPLHVFEERFRTMVEECLEEEREFGIVWLSDDELKPVGCACAIKEVLERTDDGRLLQRQDDLPYPAGIVEFVDEKEEELDLLVDEEAHALYAELVEQATDRTLTPEMLEAMSAYQMAATVDFGTEAKQELLELRSENARLRLLTLLFRAAIKQVELVERAQVRAHSNGKVHFN